MGLILMGAAVFLILFLVKKIYAKNWYKGIDAGIHVSKGIVYPGEEITLTETVVNKKWLPLPMIQVKFEVDKSFVFGSEVLNTKVSDHCYKSDVFSLLFYQKITRRLPLVCTKRGFFTINAIDVVSTDVLMDAVLARVFPVQETIMVYPEPADSQSVDIPYNRIMGTMLTRQYSYEDPFEFRGIREYQTYDSLRDINWKASARTGELKVNIHDYTASRQVVILLNLEKEGVWDYEELKEKGISMACSLACRLTEQGVGVGVISNGRDKITGKELVLQSGCDESHRREFLTRHSRIDLKREQRDFEICVREHMEEMEKGSVYVMISTAKREALQRYYNELAADSEGSIWIYPMNDGFDTRFEYVTEAEVIPWEVKG